MAVSGAGADEPVQSLIQDAHERIEALVLSRVSDDPRASLSARDAAREAAEILEKRGHLLAGQRLATAEAWGPAQDREAVRSWELLAGMEADPVLAEPEEIAQVLEACRSLGDRWCQARALLARAESLAQSGLPERVKEDAAAAEAILREEGRTVALGRALLLRRGSGAKGGEDVAAKALERYDEALQIAHETGDLSLEGRVLCERVRLKLGRRENAQDDLERIREIAATVDAPRVAACGGYFEGLDLFYQGRPADASRVWATTADSEAGLRAPRERLWSLVGVTAVSINSWDGETALRRARESVDLSDRLHGNDDRTRAYCNLTTALVLRGIHEEIGPAAQTCLELSRDLENRNGEEIALRGLASLARSRGETSEALRLYRESLAITREIRNPFDAIYNLLGISRVLRDTGSIHDAGETVREAVQLADFVRVPALQADARAKLAVILVEEGRLEEAGRTAEEALDWTSEDTPPIARAWALRARGLVRARRNELPAALADYHEASRIFEQQNDPSGGSALLIDTGNVYFRLFRPGRALEHYERAVQLARKARDRESELAARANIALLRRRAGAGESILEPLQEIIRESRQAGYLRTAFLQAANLAAVLEELRRYEEAERATREVVELADTLGGETFFVVARKMRARSLSRLGRHEEALDLCDRALARTSGTEPDVTLDALWSCGEVKLLAGRPSAAVEDLRSAMRVGEEARLRLGQVDLRVSFLGDRVSLYGDLVAALIARDGDDPRPDLVEEIFEISESFRAKLLLESMRDDSSGPILGEESIRLERARALLEDDATAGLEYLIGADHSYVIVLTSDSARIVRLEASRWDLYQETARYRGLLESRSGSPDRDLHTIRRMGAKLFRRIVEPALEDLDPRIGRLVISADGPLHLLPFEALVVPGGTGDPEDRFLVERYELSMVPSFTAMAHLRRHGPEGHSRRSVCAFANPRPKSTAAPPDPGGREAADPFDPDGLAPLPYSEEEVDLLSRRVGGDKTVYRGPEATEARARAALSSGFPIVHFATHAFLDGASIGRSGLVLAADPESEDDGLLQTRELKALDADADLVILSGCSTGVGRILGGEGAAGIHHALLQSGVPSVVYSLWAVQDRAAAIFMDRFYSRLAEGRTLGGAMREAKMDLIASGRGELRHPSVWAPFILTGLAAGTMDLPPPGWVDRYPHLLGSWGLPAAGILLVWGIIVWVARLRSRRA